MVFNPKDLTINLRAVTNPQNVLNGGPIGATFPGWFLTVLQNEGYNTVYGPRQLTFSEVSKVTDLLDRLLVFGENYPISNAADRCEAAMRSDLLRQLENAEAQAAKIPQLKKLLGEMEG